MSHPPRGQDELEYFIAALRIARAVSPHERLGQLIDNAVNAAGPAPLFYIEDRPLADAVFKWSHKAVDQLGKEVAHLTEPDKKGKP